jgi:hypothetical protein
LWAGKEEGKWGGARIFFGRERGERVSKIIRYYHPYNIFGFGLS